MNDENLRNSLRPGYKLHWYEIESVLGQGGFGITYLATDANLHQRVAIKEYLPLELAVREGDFSVYPASQSQDDRYRWGLGRFLSEARTLAKFSHSAIVRVMSVFEANNTAYMVMEYQDGRSLQQHLERRRTLAEPQLIKIVKQLLDGLEAIHGHGFIHRDIKPSNIFIRKDGHPVLLDFGSARQALGEQTQTLTSVVSPGYAPFEQYYSKSDRQGPWTDIYGLGATLYRCISGLQPMAAIDRSEAILKAERDVFVSASELGVGQYSEGFLFAIDSALQFNEKKRPQSIPEWRAMFDFPTSENFVAEEPPDPDELSDSRTRFSAVVDDDSFDVTTGSMFNPDARGTAPASDSRPSRPRTTRPSQRPTTTRAQGPSRERDAPVAPRRGQPWYAWTLLVLMTLGIAAGGWWYLADIGVLPKLIVTSSSQQDLERLVQQGDRALAAGRVFEPYDGSALSYYEEAFDINRADVSARHGLQIASEQLVAAIVTALAGDDAERAEALAGTLPEVSPDVYDFAALRERLGEARVRWAAAKSQSARAGEFLAAAQADIAAGRLTGRGTSNALAKYRAVQILEPDNVGAEVGLLDIGVRLAAAAHIAITEERLRDAEELLAQATALNPGADAVTAAQALFDQTQSEEQAAASRTERIRELLAAAETDLTARRLTSPAGNNALERYRSVLALDASNRAATSGLAQIVERYLRLADDAITAQNLDEARSMLARARTVGVNADIIDQRAQAITVERERLDALEAQRLADEATQQAAESARVRAQAESARIEAEQERLHRQEAEAKRLFEEAQQRAAEEKRREQELVASKAAVPRLIVDFYGFEPKYDRYGVNIDRMLQAVRPLLIDAGWKLVKRYEVNTKDNVKLLVFKLHVNENTASGLYSYAGSVNLLGKENMFQDVAIAIRSNPIWTRGINGMGQPSDLRWLPQRFAQLVKTFLSEAGKPR